jgi:medium-chain acyl-[acyl-carrier-protein] hydrolase
MQQKHEISFKIRSYEMDSHAKARTVNLLNYLQEAAGEHAAILGVSITDLLKKGLTWVLSRYHVKFLKYPRFGESVTVRTWPSGREEIFALRDFEIFNARNEQLAVATSSWIMLDLKNKKPAPLNEFLPHFELDTRRALKDYFHSLPPIEKTDLELPFRIRMIDLDLNRHVTHTSYLQWAMETVPQEILESFRIAEIEAAFKGEAFYGDQVLAKTQLNKGAETKGFLHQLFSKNREIELTRVKTTWSANL